MDAGGNEGTRQAAVTPQTRGNVSATFHETELQAPRWIALRSLYASALMLLQVGDCFVVNYNNRNYEIEVREAKPGNAISVVEVDCQVGIWASHLMRG